MIHIIGSGVIGLTVADQLLEQGETIHVTTANSGVDATACSWWAGGMLAPFCEMASAEALLGELAPISMSYWQQLCQQTGCDYWQNGTLVLAPNRDKNLLQHFAKKTTDWQTVGQAKIAELEPVLSTHRQGLFYPLEAHLEPRQVLRALWHKVSQHPNAMVTINTTLSKADIIALAKDAQWVVDCRGFAARGNIAGEQLDDSQSNSSQLNSSQSETLRGVRGEMLHLYHPKLTLSRPIRLLHPRTPIYLVPRANQQFMLGATMIESDAKQHASVGSVLELLSALYAISTEFLQAEIVEIGVDVRPAYPDNLPKITLTDNVFSINGMYRHGYLLAPAYTQAVANYIHDDTPSSLIRQT